MRFAKHRNMCLRLNRNLHLKKKKHANRFGMFCMFLLGLHVDFEAEISFLSRPFSLTHGTWLILSLRYIYVYIY